MTVNEAEKKKQERPNGRRNPQEYRHLFNEKVQGDYTLLTDYEKADKRVRVRHEKCGVEYDTLPLQFLKRPACRKCYSQSRRLSPEIFEERFKERFEGEFEMLNTYTRQTEGIEVKHLSCGNVFKISPTRVNSNIQCPTCKRPGLTEEFVLNKLKEEAFQGYTVTYDQYDEKTPVRIKHRECGEVFDELIGVFLKRPSCPACDKDYLQKTTFGQRVQELYGGNFKFVGKIKGYSYPVCIKHTDPNCLRYSYPFPTNVVNGEYRCPHCEIKERNLNPKLNEL